MTQQNNEAFEKWYEKYEELCEFKQAIAELAWQAAIAHMQQERGEPVPPIEYDQDMDRYYIPMIGGWEIQTKGNGSTFRICNTKTHVRWPVLDEHLHEALEQMAKDNRHYATSPRQQPLKRLSDNKIASLFAENTGFYIDGKECGHVAIADFVNAIMDEIERINRE